MLGSGTTTNAVVSYAAPKINLCRGLQFKTLHLLYQYGGGRKIINWNYKGDSSMNSNYDHYGGNHRHGGGGGGRYGGGSRYGGGRGNYGGFFLLVANICFC